MEQHPDSVPINALVPVQGTPMENNQRVSIDEMIRMIATARIIMPKSVVRLSAGRNEMSIAEQAMCFMAGANSIFAGEKYRIEIANPFQPLKQVFDGAVGRAVVDDEDLGARRRHPLGGVEHHP